MKEIHYCHFPETRKMNVVSADPIPATKVLSLHFGNWRLGYLFDLIAKMENEKAC